MTIGAILEFVTNRSQEGSQFVKGFGGIGGLLRYKVNFEQLNYNSDEDGFYSDWQTLNLSNEGMAKGGRGVGPRRAGLDGRRCDQRMGRGLGRGDGKRAAAYIANEKDDLLLPRRPDDVKLVQTLGEFISSFIISIIKSADTPGLLWFLSNL